MESDVKRQGQRAENITVVSKNGKTDNYKFLHLNLHIIPELVLTPSSSLHPQPHFSPRK